MARRNPDWIFRSKNFWRDSPPKRKETLCLGPISSGSVGNATASGTVEQSNQRASVVRAMNLRHMMSINAEDIIALNRYRSLIDGEDICIDCGAHEEQACEFDCSTRRLATEEDIDETA